MKKRFITSAIALALLLAIAANLAACALPVSAEDLMRGISGEDVSAPQSMNAGNVCATDFALQLLRSEGAGDSNTLLSPLSILCAIAMCANGAEGKTRSEIETALGMEIDELNAYLCEYVNSLPEGEKFKLAIANSIWFSNDEKLKVNKDFLQTNANFYGANIYKTAFDMQTVIDMNRWIKEETNGMIPRAIDYISEDTAMYLINALAFEGEWGDIYERSQVRDGIFTTEDGREQDAEFMYSTEGRYISDKNAEGFIKYYNGSKYAFVAILPSDNVSIDDYIASLDGESLNAMLTSAENRSVKTAIPKFKTSYSTDLIATLEKIGIHDAFDKKAADFSGIAAYDEADSLYITDVIHKTTIEVAEKGTKAGAVTVIVMGPTSAGPSNEIKEVYLDKPFIYMLIDTENSVPFFIGSMTDIEN